MFHFIRMALLHSNNPWNEIQDCNSDSNCTLALGSELNQLLISNTLYSGDYFLIIYDNGYQTSDVISCIPFSLGSIFITEYTQETNINCPGLFSN